MNAAEDRPAEAPAADHEDPRVICAVQEYLAGLESGQRPDRRELLARYADVGDAVAECLDALEFVHHAAPKLEGAAPPPSAVDLAQPLGDFRLVREVGRGGMGLVYEAVQLSLGRRVALKVLPFALTLDPRQLQRFKNEAQAAAHLHHSNIVPVYAVGCERGVHFYAMQFIDGKSLAAVIRELRPASASAEGSDAAKAATATAGPETRPDGSAGEGTGPRLPAPDPRFVAQLGAQAAEALDHAHQAGIVHRDVKPANLLVDVRGHLWVTDFGLAQFDNEAALTVTGDLLGTLRYMSPEQAAARRGVVDHRTDVWSLGATLYELLTLRPAFDGRDRQELLDQIAHQDPPSPRRLNKAVPADLETIVFKALRKSVEDRYQTAQEMADDLHRFLEHRPIRARRPSLAERSAKWVRRHRTVAAAAFGVLILAVMGLTASTTLIAQEQARTKAAYELLAAEQARTQAAYEAEAVERARAEESFRQAREVVDFVTRVSDEDLRDRPGLQELRRKLLTESLGYYQSFLAQRRDDPKLRAELAASQFRVANILQEIGDRADALSALVQARLLEDLWRGDRPPFGRGFGGSPRGPGVPRSFGPDGGASLLLTQKAVQEELQLSEEQVNQIAQVAASRRDAYWNFRGRGPDDERQLFQDLAARERALVEGLRPEQARRLGQIVLQQRGPSALAEPEVADALQLTASQREKVRSIQEDARRPPAGGGGPPMPGFFGGGFGGFGPDRPRPSGGEQLLGVLTAEQKAHWKEMLGEPFQGDLWSGFGPRRDYPPPRGRP